jgi:molybdenum cofactor cytidylyltransferase
MISLADKPLVTAQTIDMLIDSYRAASRPICVPTFEGKRGHPVIFSTGLGEEIMKLEGDRGAREVLRSRRYEVHEVTVDSDEVVLDFDCPEDMDMLISRLSAHE